MDIELIARVCHEANRAYCAALGDASQAEWDKASDWQKDSVRNGVLFNLQVLAAENKPIIPDGLEPEQRAKDYVFAGIVEAFFTAQQKGTPRDQAIAKLLSEAESAVRALNSTDCYGLILRSESLSAAVKAVRDLS